MQIAIVWTPLAKWLAGLAGMMLLLQLAIALIAQYGWFSWDIRVSLYRWVLRITSIGIVLGGLVATFHTAINPIDDGEMYLGLLVRRDPMRSALILGLLLAFLRSVFSWWGTLPWSILDGKVETEGGQARKETRWYHFVLLGRWLSKITQPFWSLVGVTKGHPRPEEHQLKARPPVYQWVFAFILIGFGTFMLDAWIKKIGERIEASIKEPQLAHAAARAWPHVEEKRLELVRLTKDLQEVRSSISKAESIHNSAVSEYAEAMIKNNVCLRSWEKSERSAEEANAEWEQANKLALETASILAKVPEEAADAKSKAIQENLGAKQMADEALKKSSDADDKLSEASEELAAANNVASKKYEAWNETLREIEKAKANVIEKQKKFAVQLREWASLQSDAMQQHLAWVEERAKLAPENVQTPELEALRKNSKRASIWAEQCKLTSSIDEWIEGLQGASSLQAHEAVPPEAEISESNPSIAVVFAASKLRVPTTPDSGKTSLEYHLYQARCTPLTAVFWILILLTWWWWNYAGVYRILTEVEKLTSESAHHFIANYWRNRRLRQMLLLGAVHHGKTRLCRPEVFDLQATTKVVSYSNIPERRPDQPECLLTLLDTPGEYLSTQLTSASHFRADALVLVVSDVSIDASDWKKILH